MSSFLRQDWIELESFINLAWILRKEYQHDNHVGFSFFSLSVNWVLLDSIVISINNY